MNANCPNCGAPVRFRFHNTVQVVCEFCRSILVRTDLDLRRVGKVSSLPDVTSPIQLGTEGMYRGKAFVVAGRILYEWENGGWSEWHIVFDGSASAWLSDAQAEYAVSALAAAQHPLPEQKTVYQGFRFQHAGREYQATTVTRARYAGVEGELPFEYWDKKWCLFVDLRSEDGRFATLDYSEDPPLLFIGEMVDVDDLNLRNLREFEGW